MAKKLLIVHGYSDGSTSFKALGDYFVKEGVYQQSDVYYVDYASMDDQGSCPILNWKLGQTQSGGSDISRGWAQKLRQARVTATR
jgi:hypothetical protein